MKNNSKPSWGALLTGAFRGVLEQRNLAAEETQLERVEVELARLHIEEAAKAIQPDAEEREWMLINSASARQNLNAGEREELRGQALRASRFSPLIAGYLRSMQAFVIGKGPVFDPVIEDEKQAEAMKVWWETVATYNKWNDLEDEIPYRLWRDGNVFIREVVINDGRPEPILLDQFGSETAEVLDKYDIPGEYLVTPDVPDGMIKIRLIDPDDISDPEGVISHGILTDPRDVSSVLGYMLSPGGTFDAFIPAYEMLHLKIGSDSDVKVGRSVLESVLRTNKQYEEWVEYRIVLNKVRTAIALVKKIPGGASKVSARRDAGQATRSSNLNDSQQQALRPGTIIHASAGIEYDYLSPNLQAADAQHDGRMLQLMMAAALNMPEYIFTGDASNANYASTMVAEAPAVKEFESWQDFLTPAFKTIWIWAMKSGAAHGRLAGLTPEDINEDMIEIRWPSMITRNQKENAESNQILNEARVKSRTTWQTEEGLDPVIEQDRFEEELSVDMEFTPPGIPAEAEAEEEEEEEYNL